MKNITGIEKWSKPRELRNELKRHRVQLTFEGSPSLTDRSQAPSCDVNMIVDRFMKTGVLPGIDVPRVYGDFSSVPDYQEALNIVARATEQFEGLSAKVKDRFDNDPAKFLEFCNDPKNGKEMVDLGLAVKRPATDLEASKKASANAPGAPETSTPKKDTPPPSVKKD